MSGAVNHCPACGHAIAPPQEGRTPLPTALEAALRRALGDHRAASNGPAVLELRAQIASTIQCASVLYPEAKA